MSLKLKNEETHQMARDLAQLTGESLTAAVTQAIRERLDREKTRKWREGRLEWLLQLSKETSALTKTGLTSNQIMDELYDPEIGLPI